MIKLLPRGENEVICGNENGRRRSSEFYTFDFRCDKCRARMETKLANLMAMAWQLILGLAPI